MACRFTLQRAPSFDERCKVRKERAVELGMSGRETHHEATERGSIVLSVPTLASCVSGALPLSKDEYVPHCTLLRPVKPLIRSYSHANAQSLSSLRPTGSIDSSQPLHCSNGRYAPIASSMTHLLLDYHTFYVKMHANKLKNPDCVSTCLNRVFRFALPICRTNSLFFAL